MKRDVQLSMVEGLERPIGTILQSVFTGSNADLMAAVAPLYLTGSVLDVTYGSGKWWERFVPGQLTFHDLEVDGVDFRGLPEKDNTVDTVCFDPPYTISGGVGTRQAFQAAYGLGHRRVGSSIKELILDGLAECCRVSRCWVLVKCMEFAQGGSPATDFHDTPTLVTNRAADLGWHKHDQIVHYTGTGPGGHNIFDVKRARRAHSYLVVFAP